MQVVLKRVIRVTTTAPAITATGPIRITTQTGTPSPHSLAVRVGTDLTLAGSNGSYYYSNPNGSTYYNNGQGGSTYTSPSGNSHSSGYGGNSSGSNSGDSSSK